MSQPAWLTLEDILGIHEQQLQRFGGASGIRDRNGIESALARPQQHHCYADTTDVVELGGIYCESFARTQHFIDGNKRVAFHSVLLFLRLNGQRLEAEPFVAAQAVLDLANKVLTLAQFTHWVRLHCHAWPLSSI